MHFLVYFNIHGITDVKHWPNIISIIIDEDEYLQHLKIFKFIEKKNDGQNDLQKKKISEDYSIGYIVVKISANIYGVIIQYCTLPVQKQQYELTINEVENIANYLRPNGLLAGLFREN